MYLQLLKEGAVFACNSVMANRLRTFLSLFGITIGIFSIISVFTVLDWMEKSIRDSIASMGDNIIYVQKAPWMFDSNIAWWDIMKRPAVTVDDYRALAGKSTRASAVCYVVFMSPQTVKHGNNSVGDVFIQAATHEFENVRSFEIESGRYFSPEESAAGKNVAILGFTMAEQLFEKANPTGKEIIIGGRKTAVVGVFRKEGQGGLSDDGMDNRILLPLNYARNFVNIRSSNINSSIMAMAKSGTPVQELGDETVMILRAARRLKPEQPTDFSINRASMLSQGFEPVFTAINICGWIIGSFSILVGGFGIANIMFVSVRERTNQIGIQKALGAKRSFILQQFLVESLMLSIAGGIVGIALVSIATALANYVFELNIHLTMGNIMLALAISGATGIVAGYSPANTAAKMDPVEAIGYSFG
ncbi:MAG: ABC transporter permease [Bacteroidales bacterium]|jgi:putative ABC transport system permease protein|nr:ABC transporter permease [Bacteroidales bacterium]